MQPGRAAKGHQFYRIHLQIAGPGGQQMRRFMQAHGGGHGEHLLWNPQRHGQQRRQQGEEMHPKFRAQGMKAHQLPCT